MIAFETDYRTALVKARSEEKVLFVDFFNPK